MTLVDQGGVPVQVAMSGPPIVVEPLPNDVWPVRYEWDLLNCSGGAVVSDITTAIPVLTAGDLPPRDPDDQPIWHSGGVRCTAVVDQSLPDFPHPFTVSRDLEVYDPCTGEPRCGGWLVTTYYTPREDSISTGPKINALELYSSSGASLNQRVYLSDYAWVQLQEQGWMLLDPDDDPDDPWDYPDDPNDPDDMGRDPSLMGVNPVRFISSTGELSTIGPLDDAGQPLLPYISLACNGYREGTAFYRQFDRHTRIGFYSQSNNGWNAGPVCVEVVDNGSGVQVGQLDWYVGIHNRVGYHIDAREPFTVQPHSGVPISHSNDKNYD